MSRSCKSVIHQLPMSEDQMQIAIVAQATLMIPEFPELAMLHHSPNGGQRHIAVAAKLKLMGVKPGFPDLILPVPRRYYHGWFGECKVHPNRLTKEQVWWGEKLMNNGYFWVPIWTIEEGIISLRSYLTGEF